MESPVDQNKFSEITFRLLLKTKYQYAVKDGKAPSATNCVTAVRYLLAKSSSQKLPPVFIGDMPRVLMQCGYVVQQIKISEMRCGDLVFFKGDSNSTIRFETRYITHIAIAIGPCRIFHSAYLRHGGSVEDLTRPLDGYAKNLLGRAVDQPFLFLRYIDPRNSKLRERYGAELIPFSIPRPLVILTFACAPHH